MQRLVTGDGDAHGVVTSAVRVRVPEAIVDTVVSSEVLKEVSSHADIQSVKMIELPAADKLPRWLA